MINLDIGKVFIANQYYSSQLVTLIHPVQNRHST